VNGGTGLETLKQWEWEGKRENSKERYIGKRTCDAAVLSIPTRRLHPSHVSVLGVNGMADTARRPQT